MKPFISLTIISFFSLINVSAQYHRMPDSVSTTWRHIQTAFGTIHDTINYINFGDTSISGKKYQKLYNGTIHDTNYIGGYRDDGNGKVYFLGLPNSLASTEVLLYDFTLQVGDTADFYPLALPLNPTKMTVIWEGCLWVKNVLRNRLEKRRYLTMSWLTNKGSGEWGLYSWLEGIGSMKGLIWRGTPSGWDFHHSLLNVYQNGDSLLGIDTSVACELDSIFSGLITNEPRNIDWSIYPVPNRGSFVIEFQKKESGVISVYDIKGVEVYRKRVYSTTSEECDLSEFNLNGVFLVQFLTEDMIKSKRIFIE